jgi:hypothetical protein
MVNEMAAAFQATAAWQRQPRRGAGQEAPAFQIFCGLAGVLVELDGNSMKSRATRVFERGGFLFFFRLATMADKQPYDQQHYG